MDKFSQSRVSNNLDALYKDLNDHLILRTFIAGYKVSIVDYAIWAFLYQNTSETTGVDYNKYPHLKRWFDFCSIQEGAKVAISKIPTKKEETKEGTIKLGSKGSYDKILLENAEMGKVKVRFPPEPSGFLHMGHFKAVLLNNYYKNHYNGKFLLRFDDTNPSNEKEEYVEAILEDLKSLGIEYDEMSRTSQFFDLILEKAVILIKQGDAYVDDSPQEVMSDQRMKCIDSVHRNNSVEKNLEMWEEMIKGSEFGMKCVLRSKIDMKHKIAALRDPSLARCMNASHPITGDRFKVYPLYDLACPIVDSVEGVTHALRDSQYWGKKKKKKMF